MKALILAGGFAKRLGTIGELMPKAMIMEKGDTIINNLIKKLRTANLEPIISTNKKFERFFSNYPNVIVEDALAEDQKLGAVSAIWNAIETMKIEEDLMVICADNYFSSSFEGFISSYTAEPLVGIYHVGQNPEMKPEEMATVKFEGSDIYPPPASSFFFTDFKEKASPPLSSYVSTGVYIFPKRIFPILGDFCRSSKQDAPGFFIEHLMRLGERIKGYLFSGEWYDVSHKSYLQAFREARVVKNDDRYIVCDRVVGGNLVLSITILHAGKQTTGHSHPVGEVYFFIEGEGEIETNGSRRRVKEKDVVTIVPNEFHRVRNTRDNDLVFISVFEKYGERG